MLTQRFFLGREAGGLWPLCHSLRPPPHPAPGGGGGGGGGLALCLTSILQQQTDGMGERSGRTCCGVSYVLAQMWVS